MTNKQHKSDFIHEAGTDERYLNMNLAQQNIADALTQILYDVQYAPLGQRAAARRDGAVTILDVIEKAYKQHNNS